MSAEATLQAHWRGITDTPDPRGVSAFADHLVELWPQAIREDAEHLVETGHSLPDVLRLNGKPTLRVRYDAGFLDHPDGRRFDITVRAARRPGLAHRSLAPQFFTRDGRSDHPPPDEWEYERVAAFVAWLWGFLKPVEEEAK